MKMGVIWLSRYFGKMWGDTCGQSRLSILVYCLAKNLSTVLDILLLSKFVLVLWLELVVVRPFRAFCLICLLLVQTLLLLVMLLVPMVLLVYNVSIRLAAMQYLASVVRIRSIAVNIKHAMGRAIWHCARISMTLFLIGMRASAFSSMAHMVICGCVCVVMPVVHWCQWRQLLARGSSIGQNLHSHVKTLGFSHRLRKR